MALRKKKVLVAGGGPAGMWAAKIATMRGHEVTLCEKSEELGGQVPLAAKGAGREEFGVIARNERSQLARLGVPVELGVEVTPDLVLEREPDAVIVATGSRPKPSPVAGADGPDVFNVWQALSDDTEFGEKVLLIDYDGHHQATATAEFLADSGKTVHIVTSSLFVGADLGPSQDLYLSRQRLLQKGVSFTLDFAVMEIRSTESGAEVHGFNVYSNVWDAISGYDSIVTAMGNEVSDDLYFVLKDKVSELYRIGDCVAPRRVDMAIHEGYMVGKRV
jgi:pyruvate/2-oxoglutarate dehydrogenase complex dihydrolipoamide dehydrogenase (E3) component